jgi:adenylylsulfate kinase
MFDDVRNMNRSLNRNYFEVYLKASEDFLARRNKKGLYSGDADLVVGRGIAIEEPKSADLVFDLDHDLSPPKSMADRMLNRLNERFWRRGHEIQHES